ncbi:MAG: hypothetical protein U0R44_00505 [Candidatus Micrarchaeia archaeon]
MMRRTWKSVEQHAPLIFYLALALVLIKPLLSPGYYIALDMVFGPSSFQDFQFTDFYGFTPSSYGAYFPLKMVMAALSAIIPPDAVEKLLLFGILFLCGLCAHYSLPKELGSSRLFAGLLYTINPFVFVRFLAGHWSILLSYSIWPVAIKSFMDFTEHPEDRRSLLNVAILTSIAAVSSHGVAILLICYLIVFVFRLIKTGIDRSLIKMAFVLAALVLLLNLYWIIPTVLLFNDTYKPVSAGDYFADFAPDSSNLGLGFAVFSMHGFWREGFVLTKDVLPYWYVPLIFLVMIAAAGFIHLLRDRALHAIMILSFFFIFFLLALGPLSPLSWIFTVFGDRLPLYLLFRDSQKFVGVIALAYSWLGAYGIHGLRLSWPARKTVILSAGLAIALLYNFGFFGFLGQTRPSVYPSDWSEAEKIMSADPIQGNVLVIPPYLYNYYPWVNSSQKTVGMPASQFFSRPVINEQSILTPHVSSDVNDPRGQYVSSLFRRRQNISNTADLLLPLGARYIVVFKDFEDSEYYLYLFKRRGGVKGISLAYSGDSLLVFRDDRVSGPFFSSKENGSGGFGELFNQSLKGSYSPDVSYKEITPASYEITASGYRYAVFAYPPNTFIRFDGSPVSKFHSLGSLFAFDGPGRFENTLFYITAALFLLSWLVMILLMLSLTGAARLVLALAAAAVYMLTVSGTIGPTHLGGVLALSASIAIIYYAGDPRAAGQQ